VGAVQAREEVAWTAAGTPSAGVEEAPAERGIPAVDALEGMATRMRTTKMRSKTRGTAVDVGAAKAPGLIEHRSI